VVMSLLVADTLPAAGAQYCPPGFGQSACASVLVIYGDSQDRGADVQAKIRGTGAFTSVDAFDARSATPTASQLGAYDAVLTYTDWHWNDAGGYFFRDAALLGDRLATYHDQGGGVVVAYAAGVRRLRGTFGTAANGYTLLDYASGSFSIGSDSLGELLEPKSPLLTGVATLAASETAKSAAPGISGRAVVVARWRVGREPLVVRGVRGGRTLVELNFWPPSTSSWSGSWTGDGAALLRNALKYSRCMLCGTGTYSTSEH
jgi:hypothetical protein